jgi:hypothetical protein
MPVLQITGGRHYRLTPMDAALITAIHRGPVVPLYADLLARAARCLDCAIAPPTAMYEGGAAGADSDARHVAQRSGLPVLTFEADWTTHGKAAGPIRNGYMLDGYHRLGPMEPPSLVLAFPGGVGTADMIAKAQRKGLPVLDLGGAHSGDFAPFQRWTKDDAWLVRLGMPEAIAEQRAKRPGVGLPIVSGHWLKVSGEVCLSSSCEYVGRTAHGLPGHPLFSNPFPVRPVGKDKPDRVVVFVGGRWTEMGIAEALGPFEQHLRHLARDVRVRAALAQLYAAGKVLVCWCDSKKPCHACIVARAALYTHAADVNRQVWARPVGSAHGQHAPAAPQGEADVAHLPDRRRAPSPPH